MITDSEGNELAADSLDELLAEIDDETTNQVTVLTDIHRLVKQLMSTAAVRRREGLRERAAELAMAAQDDDGELIAPGLEAAVEFLENGGAPDVEDIAEQIEQTLALAFPGFKSYLAELEAVVKETPKRAFSSGGRAPAPPARKRPARRAAAPAPAPASGVHFARDVIAVLPSIKTQTGPSGLDMGRYGHDSVFISSAWQRLRAQRPYSHMSLDEFKRRLIEANRNGELSLVRADLVDDMDPREVELSEIDDGYGTFHFILDPAAR